MIIDNLNDDDLSSMHLGHSGLPPRTGTDGGSTGTAGGSTGDGGGSTGDGGGSTGAGSVSNADGPTTLALKPHFHPQHHFPHSSDEHPLPRAHTSTPVTPTKASDAFSAYCQHLGDQPRGMQHSDPTTHHTAKNSIDEMHTVMQSAAHEKALTQQHDWQHSAQGLLQYTQQQQSLLADSLAIHHLATYGHIGYVSEILLLARRLALLSLPKDGHENSELAFRINYIAALFDGLVNPQTQAAILPWLDGKTIVNTLDALLKDTNMRLLQQQLQSIPSSFFGGIPPASMVSHLKRTRAALAYLHSQQQQVREESDAIIHDKALLNLFTHDLHSPIVNATLVDAQVEAQVGAIETHMKKHYKTDADIGTALRIGQAPEKPSDLLTSTAHADSDVPSVTELTIAVQLAHLRLLSQAVTSAYHFDYMMITQALPRQTQTNQRILLFIQSQLRHQSAMDQYRDLGHYYSDALIHLSNAGPDYQHNIALSSFASKMLIRDAYKQCLTPEPEDPYAFWTQQFEEAQLLHRFILDPAFLAHSLQLTADAGTPTQQSLLPYTTADTPEGSPQNLQQAASQALLQRPLATDTDKAQEEWIASLKQYTQNLTPEHKQTLLNYVQTMTQAGYQPPRNNGCLALEYLEKSVQQCKELGHNSFVDPGSTDGSNHANSNEANHREGSNNP